MMPLAHAEEFAGLEEPDKVIVRSDGTVTYVGKDIAYQLWKFGLLGKDFQYRRWEEERVWETCASDGNQAASPTTRRSAAPTASSTSSTSARATCRRSCAPGLEALGHAEQAERSVHFAYEMVALSPADGAHARRRRRGRGRRSARRSRCRAARGSASRPTTSSTS